MNERTARSMFDPRKQQLANKRKGDQQDEGMKARHKRRKNDKDSGTSAASAFAAAAKAGQDAEDQGGRARAASGEAWCYRRRKSARVSSRTLSRWVCLGSSANMLG